MDSITNKNQPPHPRGARGKTIALRRDSFQHYSYKEFAFAFLISVKTTSLFSSILALCSHRIGVGSFAFVFGQCEPIFNIRFRSKSISFQQDEWWRENKALSYVIVSVNAVYLRHYLLTSYTPKCTRTLRLIERHVMLRQWFEAHSIIRWHW